MTKEWKCSSWSGHFRQGFSCSRSIHGDSIGGPSFSTEEFGCLSHEQATGCNHTRRGLTQHPVGGEYSCTLGARIPGYSDIVRQHCKQSVTVLAFKDGWRCIRLACSSYVREVFSFPCSQDPFMHTCTRRTEIVLRLNNLRGQRQGCSQTPVSNANTKGSPSATRPPANTEKAQ